MSARETLQRLKRRDPDFCIGGSENPYIRRWWLTERIPEKWRVYLHNILRDDDDRALHERPRRVPPRPRHVARSF